VQLTGLSLRALFLFGPEPEGVTYARQIVVDCERVVGNLVPPQLAALTGFVDQLATHFPDHDNRFLLLLFDWLF
jgi:hypothetical protein